jgi:hypothetical protein
MSALRKLRDKLKEHGPRELASQAIQAVAGSVWVWAGGPALLTYLVGRWSDTAPDIKFALMFLTACGGALVWERFFREPSSGTKLATPTKPKNPEAEHEFCELTLDENRPSRNHPTVVTAKMVMAEGCTDVVLFGRWAEAVFFIHGPAKWEWTTSKRLVESASAHEGEQFTTENLNRTADGADSLTILGTTISVATAPSLFQIEIVAAAAGSKRVTRRQVYQLWPDSYKRITLPMSPEDLPFEFTNT